MACAKCHVTVVQGETYNTYLLEFGGLGAYHWHREGVDLLFGFVIVLGVPECT